jgi:hypothetical protein
MRANYLRKLKALHDCDMSKKAENLKELSAIKENVLP